LTIHNNHDKTTESLAAFYGTPPPDEERFKLLDRAHALGCVHWDSAALYGDREDLLGRWFERTGKRKDVCAYLAWVRDKKGVLS
jgi:aryl-alcohol dehydrogenase-like predicted oxidoreductase